MIEVIFGDQECKRCEDEYFSDMATKKMNKYNLCFNCIAEHRRKFNHLSLKKFSETKRDCSHYKL